MTVLRSNMWWAVATSVPAVIQALAQVTFTHVQPLLLASVTILGAFSKLFLLMSTVTSIPRGVFRDVRDAWGSSRAPIISSSLGLSKLLAAMLKNTAYLRTGKTGMFPGTWALQGRVGNKWALYKDHVFIAATKLNHSILSKQKISW